jgi:uncharacterized membrane protein YcjF (UPF0283 family)
MMNWAASSEMLVMLAVLAFLIWEWVKIRRILKRDRAKLQADAAVTPPAPAPPETPYPP